MGEQASTAGERGLHKQRGGTYPELLSRQKLFKCLLADWNGLLVDASQLVKKRGSIYLKEKVGE